MTEGFRTRGGKPLSEYPSTMLRMAPLPCGVGSSSEPGQGVSRCATHPWNP